MVRPEDPGLGFTGESRGHIIHLKRSVLCCREGHLHQEEIQRPLSSAVQHQVSRKRAGLNGEWRPWDTEMIKTGWWRFNQDSRRLQLLSRQEGTGGRALNWTEP